LVGDDQIHVTAPAQRAVAGEAVQRGQVVALDAESVFVELFDRHLVDVRRIEVIEAGTRVS
jgi:hypothetical protein